jgi:hypothetical protein
VTEAVTGTNGAVIPSGANVTIELTELKRSENTNDQIVMGFRVVSVTFDGRTYPLDADVQTATIDRVAPRAPGTMPRRWRVARWPARSSARCWARTGADLIGAAAGAAASAAAGRRRTTRAA